MEESEEEESEEKESEREDDEVREPVPKRSRLQSQLFEHQGESCSIF